MTMRLPNGLSVFQLATNKETSWRLSRGFRAHPLSCVLRNFDPGGTRQVQ